MSQFKRAITIEVVPSPVLQGINQDGNFAVEPVKNLRGKEVGCAKKGCKGCEIPD